MMLGILDGLTFFCINGGLSVDLRIRHATTRISP